MNAISLQLFIMAFLLILPMNLSAQNKKSICSEFQNHLNQRGGLLPYVVEEKEDVQEDFNFTIPNIDVDGDKIEDKILLFRTGSGSIIPSDDCSVTLILSSNGKKYTAEMQRFMIVYYKSKYYIVASDWQGEKGPIFIDVLSMDRHGLNRRCSFKCGIKDGSCAPRRYRKER